MSNNKQSIKLYTEEEVFKAIQMADKYHYLLTSEECDIVNSLTPIELPSNEEIEEMGKDVIVYNDTKRGWFVEGLRFMRDKIQGGSK